MSEPTREQVEFWKVGDEFLPYHPSASHVQPNYRDGWNACYKAASAALAQAQRDYESAMQSLECQATDNQRLTAALAQARRDAERWRHIRNGPQAWHKEQGLDWWGIELAFTEGSDKFSALDAWIDKAIAAERGQEGKT